MPDGKITRRKLKDHLRRLWAVYLAGAVALVFLNNLVYTVTRPGYSDDETLKVMLMNTDMILPEDELLARVQHLGFKCVETAALPAAAGDPTGEMLVVVQLTGGYGDIYIADEAGLDLLVQHEACLPLQDADTAGMETAMRTSPETGESYPAALRTGNGMYLVVVRNGTDIPGALAALPILFQMITE